MTTLLHRAAEFHRTAELERATRVAETVTDPEMPMLTLRDLGVLRDLSIGEDDRLVVTITPTYSGCPAMATMRDDLTYRLRVAGFTDIDVRTVLEPAWSTDWITDNGRRKLAEHGMSPPGPAMHREGPVPLTLVMPRRAVECPQCGSANTELASEFGATACKALYRCVDCREPFDHVKEI